MSECAPHIASIGVRRNEQARARRRCERHHARELRVVRQAELRVAPGPAPVEYELAPRVRLRVRRHGPLQPTVVILEQEMRDVPAARSAYAAFALERDQEFVAKEWAALEVERVPR